MTPYQRDDLALLGKAVNYRKYLAGKCAKYIAQKNVLEIGAGIGGFAKSILEHGPLSLTLLEPGDETFEVLQKEPLGSCQIRKCFSHEHLLEKSNYYDTIIYNNVLEHIEDDVAELQTAWKLLRPGGRVIVFVPAHPFLYSPIDKRLLHHRRYTLNGWSKKVLEIPNFSLESLQYVNKIGVAGWLLNKYRRSEVQSGTLFFIYDRYVLPLSALLDPVLPRWFGLSLFSVLKKNDP